jgi:hypothetical protein
MTMEQELKMLPVRRNLIADKIKSSGLNVNDFLFSPVSNDEFILNYKPINEFKFWQSGHRVSRDTQAKLYSYTPGSNGKLNFSFEYKGFDSLLENMNGWLNAIRENIEIGNPWDSFDEIKQLFEINEFTSYEEMFTDEDQIKTSQSLDDLVRHLETQNVDIKLIKEDINHLKTMTSKISKKDWKLLFVGSVTSWILSGQITFEHIHSLADNFSHIVKSLTSYLLP